MCVLTRIDIGVVRLVVTAHILPLCVFVTVINYKLIIVTDFNI